MVKLHAIVPPVIRYGMTREEALERFAPRPKWRLERIIHNELAPPTKPPVRLTQCQKGARARWSRYRAQQLVSPPQIDPVLALKQRAGRDRQRKHRALVAAKRRTQNTPTLKSLAAVRLFGVLRTCNPALPVAAPTDDQAAPARLDGGHRAQRAHRPVPWDLHLDRRSAPQGKVAYRWGA
jgi:hypothetical protein